MDNVQLLYYIKIIRDKGPRWWFLHMAQNSAGMLAVLQQWQCATKV